MCDLKGLFVKFLRSAAPFLLSATLLSAASLAHAEVAIVLNSGDGTISVINKAKMEEIRRFPIGKEPHHLMATPDDKHLIVANAASNELVFLDPLTGDIRRRIDKISDPYQIGFTPDKKWFVSVSNRLDRVDIYLGSDFSLVKRIPTGKTPSHVAFDANSTIALVTMQDSNELVGIDLASQTIKWRMKTGNMPAGVWVTPDDRYALVGMTGEDYVEVIDWRTQKSVKKITTGKGAHNFLALGDGKRLFVSNRVSNTINVIDQSTLTVVDTIDMPGGPDCMELTRDGKQLWVTTRWIKKVSIYDMASRKVIKQIPVGKSPHGIYFASHAPRK